MSKTLTSIKAKPYVRKIKNQKRLTRTAKASKELALAWDPRIMERSQIQLGGMNRRVEEEHRRMAEMREA